MKSINIFIVLFLVLLLGLDNLYAGAGNRIGTGGASQLLIPVGVRGISMGEQGVATSKGIEALFWNPAGISKTQNSSEVIFSHMNYIADIGVEYGAVTGNFTGFGTLALSIKTLSVGDIPVTTTNQPDGTGTMFAPQYLIAGLSFSRELTDKISVGLTAKYLTESLGDASASGVALDIGVMYERLADISGLSFGIVIKNLGPQMKYDGSALLIQAGASTLNRPPQYYKIEAAGFELPTAFQLGFGYRPQIDEVNSLLATASFQNNNFSDDEYRLGLEYGYNNMFFVRGGYSLSPQAPTDYYIYGLTAGVGFNYQFEGIDLKVDYAFRDVKYFDGNHIFSLTLGF
jgi:hypothetical protein